MPYTKKAIGRPAGGAGNPTPKNPNILIFDQEDVETYPTREIGVTVATEGFKLKEGTKLQPVYATPESIELLQEAEGEADARGYKKGVKFAYPGTDTDMEDFTEFNSNRNLGAIVRSCDGGAVKIIGSPCNPLSLKSETQDNKEGAKNTITLQQDIRDAFRILTYTGELPEIMNETVKPTETL
ncbi:MAG TPA: hypothetical protein DEB64_06340 [Alistipes sp.]|uniref:hypothetical protein n=1 Tax=uncultured Alistipes sp. TaxID=538949 RepID=UPI000E933D61|nr:hypothetical protein [uncultured Alistipes sp.]HBV50397.1 hypothetical protein [Alistipes sp.]